MDWLGPAVLFAILVAVVVWPLVWGRRYFVGRSSGWREIRRDLYSSSLDEGMYPLSGRAEGTEERDKTSE